MEMAVFIVWSLTSQAGPRKRVLWLNVRARGVPPVTRLNVGRFEGRAPGNDRSLFIRLDKGHLNI